MEQYYRVLDLEPTATQEEIKSQYKQLVRTHHPDRFIDPTEKAVAEERLKAINEAYRLLSSRAVEGQLVKFQQRELGLVVTPTVLDFGLLNRRERATRTFQVQFEKEVEGVDFVPSEENSWFRVARVSHLYGTELGSLEFEVEVDTTGLEAKTYQGWVDIYLDNTLARIPLTIGVAAHPWALSQWSLQKWPRLTTGLATVGLALLLLVVVLIVTSTRSFTQPQASAAASSAAAGERLLFTIQERTGPAIYAAQLNTAQTMRYDLGGVKAAAVQDGQRIAYLAGDVGAGQIYVTDLKSAQTKPLTSDATPKSQLAWAPDGERLGYLVGVGDEARIGVYDFAAKQEYRLPGAVTAGVDHFAWSPDGKTLLFDLWQGDERRVYRMAWPDGALEQLTNVDSWSGAWSPNGEQLLVATAAGILRFDSAGRQRRQLSTVIAEQVSWSVDGAWIAYTTALHEDNVVAAEADTVPATPAQQLWLMREDGAAAQRVDTAVLRFAWSPTGATLGYVTGKAGDADALHYLWTLTPGAEPQLVAEVSDAFFSWLQ